MYFKDWCFHVHGITLFSEARVIKSMFIPLLFQIDMGTKFVVDNRGYFCTLNGVYGVVFPKENYNLFIDNIRAEYQSIDSHEVNENHFRNYKNNYLYRLGLDDRREIKYNQPANISIIIDKKYVAEFFIHFGKYNPRPSFDCLTSTEVVEMPPIFLEDLKIQYYQSTLFSEMNLSTDLYALKAHEERLKHLLQQVYSNTYILDAANRLFLDYDNTRLPLTNEQACSAYALSLKVFAEINCYTLSPTDYCRFQIAATRLEAYDKLQTLRQSLKSDIVFLKYLREYCAKCLSQITTHAHGEFPSTDELAQEDKWFIIKLIQDNIDNLFWGNPHAFLQPDAFFTTLRFLPDDQNRSDTDEIVLEGGAKSNHFSIFRIIKVGILADGQLAGPDDTPHHFDYFKIENNLGSKSRGKNEETRTCFGTYITKLVPFFQNTQGEFVGLDIDPFAHPRFYQLIMEKTLRDLISIERLLLFYRAPYPGFGANNGTYSTVKSREAQDWVRLFQLRELLSGIPYDQAIRYFIRDPIDPSIRYEYFAHNQRGYLQEGGSCPIFSIKSFLDSIMGTDINSQHTNFGQQNDGSGLIYALRLALSRVRNRIIDIESLKIKGRNQEVYDLVRDFKRYLGVSGNIGGLSLGRIDRQVSYIKITDNVLKGKWYEFFAEYQQKHKPSLSSKPNFFAKPPLTGSVRILKRPHQASHRGEDLNTAKMRL
ncbi:hypothetical protein [Legionella micdadei]|uniref:hypothetical protein n=1 Tax=Legionella micdadei TaxID=451 RepID=UPI0009EF7CA6|nr:hypothetical protein [Legionella micdadei]ARH00812.1 hypothetical protein B6V88_10505 [Legionella micdadei]